MIDRPVGRGEEEGLFRALVEHMPDVVARFDREGRHLYVNPAAELATGIPQAEFIGRTHAELGMSEDVCRLWREGIARVCATGRETVLEFEYSSPGRRGHFEARLVPEVSAGGAVEYVMAVARDVTRQKAAGRERERLIRALEAEEGRLAEMFMHAPAFIVTLRGPDHVVELANSRYDQLVGHRPLIGRPLREAVPELAEQGFVRLADRVYAEGQPYVGHDVPVQVHSDPDGHPEELYLDFVLQPLREPDGAVSGIFVHAVDVTYQVRARSEVEQAAQALRESEEHYRRLVEAAPYGIYATDGEGRITEANPALGEILRRDPAELLGLHYSELVDPHDLPALLDLSRQGRIALLGVRDVEFHVRLPDGDTRLLHMRAAPVTRDGALAGSHGVVRDVTGERAKDERIRLLGTALQSLSEGVCIIAPDGVLQYANAAYARIMGIDPDRAGEYRVQDFALDEQGRQETEGIVQAVLYTGRWAGRVRRRRNDGQPVELECLVSRVQTDGRVVLLAIARDVSEELVRERHLRRTERLASVGTLLSGVAHELNNPLHAVINFAHLMLLDPRSPDDREALEIMRREADRAARIVANLRFIARQTQEETADRDLVDLNEVVEHVLKLRSYTHQTHNLEVRTSLAEGLPSVWADRGEMEQVLLNLVLNAEQALAGWQGERRLSVRTARGGLGACLVVEDTGPGIAPEHLERIFDPFFTTKAPGEGTGLGLSLVHGIVTEHGGAVSAASAPGGGARFTVELPTATRAGARPEEPPPAPPVRRLRILVVDDEPAIRASLARFLARRGHHVEQAAEGARALAMIEQAAAAPYDIVLSDLRMPGLGGEHLLQRLRELGRGLEGRVVFMTGDAASPDAARLLADGRTPVLLKPADPERVARVVERHAERDPSDWEGA